MQNEKTSIAAPIFCNFKNGKVNSNILSEEIVQIGRNFFHFFSFIRMTNTILGCLTALSSRSNVKSHPMSELCFHRKQQTAEKERDLNQLCGWTWTNVKFYNF